MPRIRTIKPDFFTSDTVSALPLRARLTWIGLWTHCDDYGHCRNNVKLIKAAVWPLDDVSLRDISEDLDALVKSGVIQMYEVDAKAYLQVTSWAEHQKVNRPSRTNIPAPTMGSLVAHGGLREGSLSPHGGLTLGRERKGKEGERAHEPESEPAVNTEQGPSPRCHEHLDNQKPPPCGGCADARKARNRWETERSMASSARPRCRLHRGQPAHNCAICRSETLTDEKDSTP